MTILTIKVEEEDGVHEGYVREEQAEEMVEGGSERRVQRCDFETASH